MKSLMLAMALGVLALSTSAQETPRTDSAKVLQAADAELNTVYTNLRSTLPEQGQRELKDAELAWIKYRDEYVRFVRKNAGTDKEGTASAALLRLTQERTQELKRIADQCVKGSPQLNPNEFRVVQGKPEKDSIGEERTVWMNYLELKPGLRIPLEETYEVKCQKDPAEPKCTFGFTGDISAAWFVPGRLLHVSWPSKVEGTGLIEADNHHLFLIKDTGFVELLSKSAALFQHFSAFESHFGGMSIQMESETGKIIVSETEIAEISAVEGECMLSREDRLTTEFNTTTQFELKDEKLVEMKREKRFMPQGPVKLGDLATFLVLNQKPNGPTCIPASATCPEEERNTMLKALRELNQFDSDTVSKPVLLPPGYGDR